MAKAVYLTGTAILGGYTIYPTTVKINEQHKAQQVDIFNTGTGYAPPFTSWEPTDNAIIRATIEGFMEVDELTSYPARGDQLGLQLDVEALRYSGLCIIQAFTIDANFDGAVKVTMGVIFTGAVVPSVP